MAEGVDYSHARPNPACLFANGKRFAVRYVGTPSSGKNLTVAEANRLRGAGLDLVAVYQTTADFMLQGFNRGVRAAREATTDAARYGLPAGRPIYYALDIDPRALTAAQWNAINAFLDGAASVTGRSRVGAYGGWLAIEQLVPENAAFGWQTYAWSRGAVSRLAHLYQYRNGVTICGGEVDLCRSLKPDYGQWSLKEDDMSAQDVAAIKAHIDDRINWVTSRLDHNRWDENSSGLVHIYRREVSTNEMVKRLTAEVAALRSAVAQLGAGGNIDYARVEAAAEKAVRDVLGGLDTAT